MSNPINFFKRVSAGLLILILLASILCIGTGEVAAEGYIQDIYIATEQPLYQNADIATFLSGVDLVTPGPDMVDKFKYSLTYTDGGNPVNVNSGTATQPEYIFTIEITLYEGYAFDSTDNINASLNGTPMTIINAGETGSTYLTGFWKLTPLPRYKVSFDTDGGKPVPPDQWVVKGQKVVHPEKPAKTGYEFLGWWHDVPGTSEQWDFSQGLSEDLSLIARWKPTATTTPKTTVKTTPIVIEVTTTTPAKTATTTPEAIEPTTTDTSDEITTTPDIITTETSPAESGETTSSSAGGSGAKGGFNYQSILFILGGTAFLLTAGTILFIVKRKNK